MTSRSDVEVDAPAAEPGSRVWHEPHRRMHYCPSLCVECGQDWPCDSYKRVREHVGPRGEAKQGYPSPEAARVVAALTNTRPERSLRRPYEPYLCSQCGEWHVGRVAPLMSRSNARKLRANDSAGARRPLTEREADKN